MPDLLAYSALSASVGCTPNARYATFSAASPVSAATRELLANFSRHFPGDARVMVERAIAGLRR